MSSITVPVYFPTSSPLPTEYGWNSNDSALIRYADSSYVSHSSGVAGSYYPSYFSLWVLGPAPVLDGAIENDTYANLPLNSDAQISFNAAKFSSPEAPASSRNLTIWMVGWSTKTQYNNMIILPITRDETSFLSPSMVIDRIGFSVVGHYTMTYSAPYYYVYPYIDQVLATYYYHSKSGLFFCMG